MLKLYSRVDHKSYGKLRLEVSKIVKQIQSTLSNPKYATADVIVRCFKLIDILFDHVPESFLQDISTLYPMILVNIVCSVYFVAYLVFGV